MQTLFARANVPGATAAAPTAMAPLPFGTLDFGGSTALITDNDVSFQHGAGVSLRGATHTVISRNKFTDLGGEGLVIDLSEQLPPPPPPEPQGTPADAAA